MSEALGVELSLQDGIIQGYEEQINVIEDLIEIQRAQAVLDSMESDYQEAVQKKTEALQNQLSLQRQSMDVESQLADARQKLAEITEQAKKEAELYGSCHNGNE